MPNPIDPRERVHVLAMPCTDRFARLRSSTHATKRTQQRGYRPNDLELIVRHGTKTSDGYILLNRDADAVERSLKREIQKVNLLRGSYVIAEGDAVISIYRPGNAKRRRLLRQARATGRN